MHFKLGTSMITARNDGGLNIIKFDTKGRDWIYPQRKKALPVISFEVHIVLT